MAETIGLTLCLTQKDKEIIEWLNMLQAAGESPFTWIQAILLADFMKEPIDIGGVAVVKKQRAKPRNQNASTIMFGDDSDEEDSETDNEKHAPEVYKAGNILRLRITRPVVVHVMKGLKRRNKKVATYVKALIRQRLRRLETGHNEMPKEANIEDLFILLENKLEETEGFQRTSGRETEQKASVSEETKEETAKTALIPEQEPTKKPDPAPAPPPEPSQKPQEPLSIMDEIDQVVTPEQPKKRRNPLLDHIH